MARKLHDERSGSRDWWWLAVVALSFMGTANLRAADGGDTVHREAADGPVAAVAVTTPEPTPPPPPFLCLVDVTLPSGCLDRRLEV